MQVHVFSRYLYQTNAFKVDFSTCLPPPLLLLSLLSLPSLPSLPALL